MRRFRYLPVLWAACLSVSLPVAAQDVLHPPKWEQIPGPPCAGLPEWDARSQPAACTPNETAAWLRDIVHWRNERRIRAGYEDSFYRDPATSWTQSSFVQPQMMIHDRYFYDPAAHRYTVGRYLDDTKARYGGIDSVLVWPTYPNIGVDSRNAYDLFRDMPGGIAGVKQMVEDFHKRGVRVLFPIMLWDQGTHEEGVTDAAAIARNMAAVGADGINGDTLDGVPRVFVDESVKAGHKLVLEPELGPASDEAVAYNTMTWGYWDYGFVPTVSRYKWMEPRHLVHVSNRWAHDHLDDLQFAFFNGTGFESWENIWGIWNQMTPRDAEALRRIATIERAYAPLLVSPEWQPHAYMQQYGIFASRWPTEKQTLWTIVNRNAYPVSGRQIRVSYLPNVRYFDLWHGVELTAVREGDAVVLSFDIEQGGFGAVLQQDASQPAPEATLSTMKALSAKPLTSYSHAWQMLPQQLVAIAATKAPKQAPEGMAKVPAAEFVFRVNGIEIEGTNDEGVDVQYPWETSPRRYHEHTMHIDAFWMDKTPVTNAEFKRFMDATHYKPADDHNFLKDWKGGAYPAGWEKKPVTWVSLEDARAYAAWAGKRLPHEWEWQYAAQGTDGRVYPWGNEWDFGTPPSKDPLTLTEPASVTVPKPDRGRDTAPAADVDAHPMGASPFGVLDLVGNVWQWTDEYMDEHTRAGILRGGSHYQPQGSRWYFPQAYKLSQHGKYLLMAPSIDRAATVGFRCVMDAQ
jgi:gamma-glutamyl hercynylcysteine S-oxide synthase